MRAVLYYLLGVVALYMQVLLAPGFAFAALLPSFLLGFVIYTSTRLSLNGSVFLAFLLGIAVDMLYPLTLGLQSLTLLIIAILVNRLHPHLNKEKTLNVLLGVLVANLIYTGMFSAYHMLAYPIGPALWLRIPLSLVLNLLLSVIEIVALDLLDRLRLVMHE